MISVAITKRNNQYYSILFDGHAGYDDAGYDIVCSAVSVLVLNTINSIEKFTDDAMTTEFVEEDGHIFTTFPESLSEKSQVLLDAMLLGLEEIQKQYGDEYISLLYKEV
ncbi:hypothetical protein SAMN02910298_00422 [Pseudobutyrivibrio sp. YE44]|uniref:ribosomal-processing cysteine protease Prp n=1 Tax=Pseudobutyrivibrio sp. YE44 TaxID=1520802 RepID=UPI00087FA410|nr:ribosomal-processing cysteine protease Prp [Pseudobutyrivibrio sp. YE44]SDB09480.1 hypothetical protein SAMN02910298_00422 [Pseudobutyrivibrio sp. YE44]